jgi:uncharacterized membrane protein (DUF106 family)
MTNFILAGFYTLFELSPLLAIGIVAFLVTLLTNIVTKYTTDQEKIKRLKNEMKDLQDEMKQVGDDAEAMQDIQSQIWPKQKELMLSSMKPFIYYGIPLLLVFAWLSQTIAYQPIQPGDDFSVTAYVDETAPNLSLDAANGLTASQNNLYDPGEGVFATQWTVNADEPGQYNLSVIPDGTNQTYTHSVTVTDTYGYGQVEKTFDNSKVNRLTVGYQATHPFGSFSIFGYQPGWLATYIVLSLAFNLVLRKLLDVA